MTHEHECTACGEKIECAGKPEYVEEAGGYYLCETDSSFQGNPKERFCSPDCETWWDEEQQAKEAEDVIFDYSQWMRGEI